MKKAGNAFIPKAYRSASSLFPLPVASSITSSERSERVRVAIERAERSDCVETGAVVSHLKPKTYQDLPFAVSLQTLSSQRARSRFSCRIGDSGDARPLKTIFSLCCSLILSLILADKFDGDCIARRRLLSCSRIGRRVR